MKFRMINLKFRILVMPWREVELFCHSKCNEILIKFDINALKPIQLHAIGFHRYTDWSIIEIIFQIERLNWNLVFVHYVLYQFPHMISMWRHYNAEFSLDNTELWFGGKLCIGPRNNSTRLYL